MIYVAFLRGLNVGGKNRIKMPELIAAFMAAGCEDVGTFIQSGNVLFRASAQTVKRVPQLVSGHLSQEFDINSPVVMRSAKALEGVVSRNPFLKPEVSTQALHVAFLAEVPQKQDAAALDPNRSPPDVFECVGQEVYLHCPNGLARSKLTNAWFDSRLKTVSTVRNWNTVLELAQLAKELQ